MRRAGAGRSPFRFPPSRVLTCSQRSIPAIRDARHWTPEVSPENVEPVRCFYAGRASEGSPPEFDQRLTDDALSRFLDPGVEWVAVPASLLAVRATEALMGLDTVLEAIHVPTQRVRARRPGCRLRLLPGQLVVCARGARRCARSPWGPIRVSTSADSPTAVSQCGVHVLNSAASPGASTRSSSPTISRTRPLKT